MVLTMPTLRPLRLVRFGWDDRVANGFCGSCNLEAQLGFASLTIRACNDFAATLKKAGDTVNATRYSTTARALAATLRARPATTVPGGKWYADYGVHAAACEELHLLFTRSPQYNTLALNFCTAVVTFQTCSTHSRPCAPHPVHPVHRLAHSRVSCGRYYFLADMINAEIVADADEQEAIFHKVLTNSVTICSWSPFNQFWILQALVRQLRHYYYLPMFYVLVFQLHTAPARAARAVECALSTHLCRRAGNPISRPTPVFRATSAKWTTLRRRSGCAGHS